MDEQALVNATEHALMTAVSRGNLAVMSDLYERRHRPLFRFFFRLSGRQTVAEDLTHEVFLRMIRYRETYRSEDKFEAWMYRIARNAFMDHTRKHRLESPAEEGQLELAVSNRSSAFEDMSKRQDLATLHKALGALPAEKRELIVMSRFQGLSYEQIGQILGVESGTVKGRMFRAMKEIGKIFGELREERAS
jgi:RNA polymerase sigma-70 factor (ECF subfamily)